MSTMTETRNETPSSAKEKDLRQEVQEIKHQLELQTATQAGVDATQVATTAGAQATQAAAHAGTWSTMIAGSAGLVVGMFLAITLVAVRPR